LLGGAARRREIAECEAQLVPLSGAQRRLTPRFSGTGGLKRRCLETSMPQNGHRHLKYSIARRVRLQPIVRHVV